MRLSNIVFNKIASNILFVSLLTAERPIKVCNQNQIQILIMIEIDLQNLLEETLFLV